MQAMVCELCGSNDIVKQDGVYVCQHCGTKYSVEEAKKLIGVVKIDKTDETEKLLVLARRAKDENNEENAAKYYDMVLRDDPTNWEASFYLVYFQAMGCKIIGISNAAYSVANNISGTIKLIREHVSGDEQEKAIAEVILHSSLIATMLANAAENHYKNHSTVDGAFSECSGRVVAAGSILEQVEKGLKADFADKPKSLLSAQKILLSFISNHAKMYNNNYRDTQISRLTNEIKRQDSSYTPPEVKSGGCYVATAVYGSYDCPQVWTLRRYRDFNLANTWYGRMFIHAYYAVSPTIVKWFGNAEWFKKMWRGTLDRMVQRLNAEGYKNTPYNDRNW